MSTDSSAAFLRSLLGGIKTIYVGGAPVVLPAGTTPSTRVNFASGVSAVYNATTGAIDMTVTAVAAAEQATNTLANGLNSNIPVGSNTSLRFGGPTEAFSVGGFALPGGATPVPGQTIDFDNTTAYPMTIVHLDGSSTAKYQISVSSQSNYTYLAPYSKGRVVYDGTLDVWKFVSNGPAYATPQFLGNALSWSVNPLYTGMAAFVTGLSVPCAVGAVLHVGRPPTWPPGVVLSAIATAANTVTLEALNATGSTQTLPTASTDIFTIVVHQ